MYKVSTSYILKTSSACMIQKYLIQSLCRWSWLWFCILLAIFIDNGVLVLSARSCLVLNGFVVSIEGVGGRWGR